MAKRLASAGEIEAEIERRIRASDALDGDCRDCGAPEITRLAEPHAGVNWTVDTLPGCSPPCVPILMAIIRDVMKAYDVKD